MAYPSDLVRTKDWGNETLTDSDLEGQFDLIIDWVMAFANASTGHKHDATSNEGPKIATLASTVTGDITFSGTLTLSNDPTFSSGNGLVPSGAILAWSGAISAIPSGWVICDGNNSTPDLTDRFILHADADSGGTNDVGDTGGASTHTLTTDEMPAHTHSISTANDESQASSVAGGTNTNGSATTASTGGGNAHNNRDKYYALAYIMKT